MVKTVKCNKCGWYHFERTRDEVVHESVRFNDYITKQPPEVQEQFGLGPLSRDQRVYDVVAAVRMQEKCFRCGNSYKDFVDDDGKCPLGVTMQGIIRRDE